MHKFESRRFKINKVILANTIMILAVVLIVTVLVLITMGYSLTRDGKVEQTGLVQLASVPSGAAVQIDGAQQFSKTSTKATLTPGLHSFAINRSGYDVWNKKANVYSGSVLWLNYARLLPNEKVISPVKNHETLYKMSSSPKSEYILLLWPAPGLAAQLIDIRSDTVKTTDVQLAAFFTDLSAEGVQHDFQVKEWNRDENKVLVWHGFADRSEWVWLNLKNPSESINLTDEYRFNFSDIRFASGDGNKLLALESGNLRRADIGGKTVSAVLVNGVLAMSRVSDDEALLVTDNPAVGTRSFSFYKHGNRGASEIYSLDASKQAPLGVVGGEYYGDDFAAISEGHQLQILKGTYPSFGKAGNSLNPLLSVKLDWPVEQLELSANKRFIYAINKENVYNYDLENGIGQYFKLAGTHEASAQLNWLDGYMLWTDGDGQLTVYDFDGDNKRAVQKVEPGFKVVLTGNGKWLYSVGKTETGYSLQRLRMVID